MKIGNVFLLSLSPFLVLTGGKETKESQAPAGGIFFVRRWAGKGDLDGDWLLLFVGKVKIESAFLVILSSFLVLTGGKETKESQDPAGVGFFVRRWAGIGDLDENRLLLFVGKVKIEGFKHRYFYTIRGGRVDMSARYFSKKLWGRMRYAPTLTDEKGAFPLFAGGRGRGILTRIGFFYLLGR